MKKTPVVTVFVTRGDEILLLKRSSKVGTYRGHWAGVSGFVEARTAHEQALRELAEELGLGPEQGVLSKGGQPLEVVDDQLSRTWLVHPFLFVLSEDARLVLDWEHEELRWITPHEMRALPTVPGLWQAWCRVAPSKARSTSPGLDKLLADIAGDTEKGASELALLGIGGLALLADQLPQEADRAELLVLDALRQLDQSRPAMASIGIQGALTVDRARQLVARGTPWPEALRQAARQEQVRAHQALERIADQALAELGPGGVLVSCSWSKAVLQTIETLKPIKLSIGEGGHLGDGARAAARLAEQGIAVEVIADGALPTTVEGAKAVLVGADQVLADGSVVNRSSTFSLALAAKHYGVRLYVLSQRIKFTGRGEADLTESAPLGRDLPAGVKQISPMFDLTPARLIHRLIDEKGVQNPDQAARLGQENAALLAALLAG